MTGVDGSASRWLGLLGGIKVVEGIALCAIALELFELIDQDLAAFFDLWISRLHVDPHNPIIAAALGRAGGIDRARLAEYGDVAGAFGGMSLIQGIGLWLRRAWAEYVCAFSTAAFLPLEVHELIASPHVASAGMLAVNAAVVAYLVRRIRVRRRVAAK
jgi:uncharacterized membrane protein (DUF2068 family)